jgi:glycosyltransferase involved in cell wall biosynthesis
LPATLPLSIGLPVDNGERCLSLVLDDLLAQSYGDVRLMLFGSASEDATGEIWRDYAARDPRIGYFFQNESPLYKWTPYDDGHALTTAVRFFRKVS